MKTVRMLQDKPRHGDTRIIKKFALLPIAITNGNIQKTRWLETCYIKQTYSEYFENYMNPRWINKCFVEERELKK